MSSRVGVFDMNEMFGELRTLLESPHKDEAWVDAFVELVGHALRTDEARWHEEWRPYLESVSPRLPVPLLTVADEDELLVAASMFPGALFRYEGHRLPLEDAHLSSIVSLSLRHGTSVEGLVAEPKLNRITELSLQRRDLGDEDLLMLSQAQHLQGLVTLDLSHNSIGDNGIVDFARFARCDKLEVLDLGHNAIGFEGATALAQASRLKRLEMLVLRENELDGDLVELLHAPALSNVLVLDLGRNAFGREKASEPTHAERPLRLEELYLNENQLLPSDLVAILQSAPMPALLALDLGGNSAGDDVAMTIARSPYLANLEELGLDEENLSKAGVRALAESEHLSEEVRRTWKQHLSSM